MLNKQVRRMISTDLQLNRIPVIDFSINNTDVLKRNLWEALDGKVSPCCLIKNYGFDKLIRNTIENHKEKAIHSIVDDESNSTVELSANIDLNSAMKKLAFRFSELLIPDFDKRMKEEGIVLTGDSKIRYYPSKENRDGEGMRLGAHVDGNFITILWNSSNGLQIPKNSSNVTAQDIMYMGTPTTGEHRTVLEESDWVNVDLPSDMLLVTIGFQWFTSFANNSSIAKVASPVLHRVFVPYNNEARFSIPYLCRLSKEE